jgi:site-specific recombinase XerD
MDNAQIRYVFDRRREANNDTRKGLLQIEVRLSKSSIRRYFSTGIRIFKNQFSNENGFTCRNHPNAALITGKARKMFGEIEAFVLSDKCTTLHEIRNWDKDESQTHSVIDFMRAELRRRNPSYAVIEYNNVLMRKLEVFGKIRVFADLTYSNLIEFDTFLRKTIKSQPVLYKNHAALHRYIREAIKRGLCKYDPYNDFEMPKGKSRPQVYLTEEQMDAIREYHPHNDRMQRIKDLFMFQCMTGLAFIDLMNLTSKDIQVIDGSKVIVSSRKKTHESFVVFLYPEAEEILDKYSYNLPRYSNQKYNDYLKILAAGAGVNIMLTSHMARHTFATWLLNRGVPITTVQKALGHSSVEMTEKYARLLNKTVISDMKKVIM